MEGTPNVSFKRPELAKLLPMYKLIRDCLSGEPTIKSAKTTYLPMPDAHDKCESNLERYKAYVLRAVFYNVTRRTVIGLVGQVFMRDPIVEVPALLEPVLVDANGAGVSLTQLQKKSLSMTLAYSRSGLFIDYPESPEGGASKKELEEGHIRPTIAAYSPLEIINWRVIERGAKELLSLVVLSELYCVADDGFEMKNSPQFRVLRLNEAGQYIQEIWREPTPSNADGTPATAANKMFQRHETIVPTDANGEPFKEIPFTFIGSDNNDTNPDNPNLYDLASINIAHYRNSADYEEACYIVGQPTPVITGLNQEWYTNVLKGTIGFGSRGGIPLPPGATAELLQAEPNTMIKEAMETKERQMVALGAKLVEQKEVQRTAFETKVEATSEGSILSSTTKNVAAAYEFALKWCCKFVGEVETTVKVELNTDFDIARMTPEERQEVIKEWQAGALTFEEMRAVLRKAGSATEDDEVAKGKIETETVKAMALQMPENTPESGGDPTQKPVVKKGAVK